MLTENSNLFDPLIAVALILFLLALGVFLFFILRRGPKIALVVAMACTLFAAFAISYGIRAKLTLQINSKGITFNYPPFSDGETTFLWADIKSIKLITFDAEKEFGGWGKKHSDKYGIGYLSKGGLGLYITDSKNIKITITVLDSAKAEGLIRLYQYKSKKIIGLL